MCEPKVPKYRVPNTYNFLHVIVIDLNKMHLFKRKLKKLSFQISNNFFSLNEANLFVSLLDFKLILSALFGSLTISLLVLFSYTSFSINLWQKILQTLIWLNCNRLLQFTSEGSEGLRKALVLGLVLYSF